MAIRFITPKENAKDYENTYQAVFTLSELTEEALKKLLDDPFVSVFMPKKYQDTIWEQFKIQMKEAKTNG
jgi:hypothetical protein